MKNDHHFRKDKPQMADFTHQNGNIKNIWQRKQLAHSINIENLIIDYHTSNYLTTIINQKGGIRKTEYFSFRCVYSLNTRPWGFLIWWQNYIVSAQLWSRHESRFTIERRWVALTTITDINCNLNLSLVCLGTPLSSKYWVKVSVPTHWCTENSLLTLSGDMITTRRNNIYEFSVASVNFYKIDFFSLFSADYMRALE